MALRPAILRCLAVGPPPVPAADPPEKLPPLAPQVSQLSRLIASWRLFDTRSYLPGCVEAARLPTHWLCARSSIPAIAALQASLLPYSSPIPMCAHTRFAWPRRPPAWMRQAAACPACRTLDTRQLEPRPSRAARQRHWHAWRVRWAGRAAQQSVGGQCTGAATCHRTCASAHQSTLIHRHVSCAECLSDKDWAC